MLCPSDFPNELLESLYTSMAVASMGFDPVDLAVSGGSIYVVAHEDRQAFLQIRIDDLMFGGGLLYELWCLLGDLVSDPEFKAMLRESFKGSFTFKHADQIVEAILGTGIDVPVMELVPEATEADLAEYVRTVLT